jgi:acyl-CoA synthetase (AMP-forming)/AMP-acid ligase II
VTPVAESIRPARNYVRRALQAFARYGEAEALVGSDGRRFTHAELRSRILDTAALLWDHGVRPGMTVAMLVTNPPESFFANFAAHLLGCRTVFPWRTSPAPFIHEVLSSTSPDVFIYQVEHIGELGRALAEASPGMQVFCIGAGGLGPDITDPPRRRDLPFDPDAITVEPVTLFHTSGTTGTPKLLRHGERFFSAIPSLAAYYRPPDRAMRHLLASGAWHAGGMAAAVLTLVSGGTGVINFGFDVGTFVDTLAKERITSFNISPPCLYMLLDDPGLTDLDLSGIHSGTLSAAPVAPARLAEAVDRFGRAFDVVYGMSELPFITAYPRVAPDPATPERLASCGRAWGDVSLEIRDPDGRALPRGEVGEICVQSELMLEDYLGAVDSDEPRLADGWLRTGDAGRLDHDGYLYIVDRYSDMIITAAGSENIFCRPIEDALIEHPDVLQAAVIGVPDPATGEAIHAYVVRAPSASTTEDEVRRFVEDRLNALWSPRRVEFIDGFPLTEYGKVDKRQLRARYAAQSAADAP